MARFFKILLLLILLTLTLSGGALLYGGQYFAAPGPLAAPTTVIVAPKTPFRQIAAQLAQAGVIRQPTLFSALVMLRQEQGRLKAGEYLFPPHAAPQDVLIQMTEGRVVVHNVTLPEGRLSAEAAAIVNAEPLLTGDPVAVPEEGSLLPETYQFLRGDPRAALLGRMQKAQAKLLAELWAKRAPNLPFASPRDAVILASVVEKETGKPDERGHVASVFLNRLAAKMPLQSDPTTIYGLYKESGALRLMMTRADLAHPTPYNTYTLPGLPVGPICNPGRASLEAVLNPPTTPDLYFVADGTGGHRFAATLEEHNRNVAAYRHR